MPPSEGLMPAVAETLNTVETLTQSTYKWGFESDIQMDLAPKGLNEDIVAIQNASPLLLIYAALCYSQCPTLVVSYASDVAAAAVSPPVRAAWCTSHLCIVLSVQCPHPRLQPSGIAPLPNWASIPNLQPVTCWTGCSSAPGLHQTHERHQHHPHVILCRP